MFESACHFTMKESVVRNCITGDGEVIRLSVNVCLTAQIESYGIIWKVTEERWVKGLNDVYESAIFTVGTWHCNFHVGSYYDDPEWLGRMVKTNVVAITKAIGMIATKESGDLIYDIFMGLYYPSEREDQYNSWVKESAPEIHEKMINNLRMRNMQTVREVMEA